MRTRSALAGLIVVVMFVGLGATPVAADDGPHGGNRHHHHWREAHADWSDRGDPGDPGTAPAAGTADAAAGDAGSADAAGDDPGTTVPADSGDPGTTAAPGPADPEPGSPPGPATSTATAPPATSTSSQTATADAASVAVADTGHNTATNSTVQVIAAGQAATAPTSSPATADATPGAATAGNTATGGNAGVGLAVVVTGSAAATGGATTDTISQKALVKAVGTGQIDIVQIALVVNLGVGVANTGGNTATGLDAVNVIAVGQGAGATDGTAGGVATDGLVAANSAAGSAALTTGSADALGNGGDVRVIQAVDAAAGSGALASAQSAGVSNVGVAVANSGVNLVIGNTVIQLILVDQQAAGGAGGGVVAATNQAAATNGATGTAAVTTGPASAIGNSSSTAIDQTATADAGDGGFVSILQRALVLNLGLAFANTGLNDATGNQSLDLVALQQQSIAGAFWTSLQSLFGGSGWLALAGSATGTAANDVTASNTSTGTAALATGAASATGLASTTAVGQTASASAGTGGTAVVSQDATVTNAGLAIANTGANDVAGLLAVNAVSADQWAGLGAFLAAFLGQVGAGAATAAPATSSFTLGDVLVDLFGDVRADEVLIDGFGALSGGQVEAGVAQALGFADGFTAAAATAPGATGPLVRVRQITGTLTINLGIVATGGNTARTSTVDVVVLDQQADTASASQVSQALGQGVRVALAAAAGDAAPAGGAVGPANMAVLVNATTGTAVVVTGDASASNRATLAVCQTSNVDPVVCAPPVDPQVDPQAAPSGPALAPAPLVAARALASPAAIVALPAQALPRTGNDPAVLLELATLLLTAGVGLRIASVRRRRVVTSGGRGGSR